MTTVATHVVPIKNTAHKNATNKTKKVKRRQKDQRNRKIRKNVVRDLEQQDDLALYQRTFQLLKDVYGVEDLEWVENSTPLQFLESQLNVNIEEDNIAICDLGVVIKQYLRWKHFFPRVHPYYGMSLHSLENF